MDGGCVAAVTTWDGEPGGTVELRDQLEQTGHWLFRHRSWLPLIPLILVVVGLYGYEYPAGSRPLHRAWGVLCIVVGLIGVWIRVITVGYIAGDTSVRSRVRQMAKVLNRKGIYSVVRHPLYLGNYFMWLGVALVPRSPWIVLVVTLVFWLYYERIMLAEEDFLRGKFGSAFETWAAGTPTFIPRLSQWVREDRPFSVRMVLRREHSGIYGLIVAIGVLAQAADMVAAGRVQVDPFWMWILGVTTVVFLIVILLKRHTAALEVYDR